MGLQIDLQEDTQRYVREITKKSYQCCNITIPALQYYNLKEKWENNSDRRRQKSVLVEEFNQRNDKKRPFHRGKWAKKAFT